MPIKLTEGQYFGREIKSLDDEFVKYTLSEYLPYSAIESHFHENNYLCLLVKGRYNEINEKNKNFFVAGNLIFRPSSYLHSNHFDEEGSTCFNIELKGNWKEYISSNINLPSESTTYKTGSLPSIYKLLHHFIRSDQALLFELLLDLFFKLTEEMPSYPSLPWISKVKSILENEIDQHHTLYSIAERVFVHPVHLARAFKLKTGYTIGEYQQKVKLEVALSLLFNTSLSVTEIALRSGFYDSAHLINSFKRLYTVSPNQFRSIQRKLI